MVEKKTKTAKTEKPAKAAKVEKTEKQAKIAKPAKPAKKAATSESTARAKDYRILVKPVITEKGAGGGTPVFWVDPRASKEQIKEAVERVFAVNVEKVRTLNLLGKPKKKGRAIGRRASKKKAYIWLKDGQTIELVEGI
jgi:large subunit ribosomal protein L23